MLEQSKTTKEIDEAIFSIQSKAPVIKKKAENDYYKSKYAEYPDIQKEIRPLLAEAKILVKSFPVEGNKIIFMLTHMPSQEYYKATIDLNSVTASPQAQGSAITYMKRYALVAALDLIIEGDDDDGNRGSETKQQQKKGQQQQATAPVKKDLNPENKKDWNNAVLCIQNKKYTLEDIIKGYNMTEPDKALLLAAGKKAKPVLKPGSKQWEEAIEYLSKEGNKMETIEWRFTISEADKTDLQVDVIDHKRLPKTPDNQGITPNIETKTN